MGTGLHVQHSQFLVVFLVLSSSENKFHSEVLQFEQSPLIFLEHVTSSAQILAGFTKQKRAGICRGRTSLVASTCEVILSWL